MKVGVTGANGKVGKYVVAELLEHGYEVRAITLQHWEGCPVEQRRADVTRLEQVRQAIRGCDAIIHLAAIPSPYGGTEVEVFHTNAMGTYHVLLAAGECGIQRVAIASSDCAYGVTYSITETKPVYLPVDERHPTSPDNCYGLSKVVAEQIAEAMAKRFGITVASLRITFVVEPHEYEGDGFRSLTQNPEDGPWNLWSYLDARDCARAFRLSIEKPFDGHEIFCIAAEHQRCVIPSSRLAERYYPEAELRRPFAGHESFLDCTKARRLLGYVPQYGWNKEDQRA